jgi:Ser-tRNA(Ala) deacylase AlaX
MPAPGLPRAPTQRLYLEDPRRKTALASVTAHAAGGFALDRTVFHAADPRYHHAQPCDRGHVVAEGHKLKIDKVGWDKGRLVHRTHGPLPAVGAKAQLHLDAERRALQARAHALAHLALSALAALRAECVAQPEVVGGGEVRFAARLRSVAPADVARRVAQLAGARLPVEASWMPRDEAEKRAIPQAVPFARVAPEEPTLRVVRIGESLVPCDAPLVERSSDVGEARWAPPVVKDGVARLRARVAP